MTIIYTDNFYLFLLTFKIHIFFYIQLDMDSGNPYKCDLDL